MDNISVTINFNEQYFKSTRSLFFKKLLPAWIFSCLVILFILVGLLADSVDIWGKFHFYQLYTSSLFDDFCFMCIFSLVYIVGGPYIGSKILRKKVLDVVGDHEIMFVFSPTDVQVYKDDILKHDFKYKDLNKIKITKRNSFDVSATKSAITYIFTTYIAY